MNTNYLNKPIKITVCCDGFVSIMRTAKDKRLRAGLPCYSVDNLPQALELIRKVCILRCCEHGGKTGTLVEPWMPDWPLVGGGTLDDLDKAGNYFAKADGKEPK